MCVRVQVGIKVLSLCQGLSEKLAVAPAIRADCYHRRRQGSPHARSVGRVAHEPAGRLSRLGVGKASGNEERLGRKTSYMAVGIRRVVPAAVPVPLEIEAANADALFDNQTKPAYPHTGPMVDPGLGTYLEELARERPRSSSFEIRVTLNAPVMNPADEDRVRRQIQSFFVEEEQLAQLHFRVNRREAVGFLPIGMPLVIVALVAAGLLYVVPGATSPDLRTLLTALLYLLFISVVWVLLWDPIEKLLFDGYMLRRRVAALSKLGAASIRFTYVPPSPTSA